MIERKLTELSGIVEKRLRELFAEKEPKLLWDSMYYSVEAGGKRLRPALNLMAAALKDVDPEETLDIACAIEMIHTYSLIHDDLPALDNDALRRGKPSNHMVYGEAQAILAGDGLLSYAFEVMIQNAMRYDTVRQIRAISRVANAAGVFGMVAGQVLDVALEGQPLAEEQLEFIHTHKTADMIVGALLAGLELGNPTEEELHAVETYGRKIGFVFQIVDDVLDVTADESLGKTLGKDAAAGKTTFASKFGVGGAMHLAEEYNEQAKEALSIFGGKADELCRLADMLLYRRK